MKGIDISYHNGDVDFDAVKNSGVDFVIIRAGFGREVSQEDKKFEEYYQGAKNAGLDVGAYWYSYATDPDDAQTEAEAFLQVIDGKQFSYPVYFDIEDPTQANFGMETITQMCERFCSAMENQNYYVGIYANTDWWQNRIDQDRTDSYTRWLADYRANPNTSIPRDMHQYTSSGSVDGISGRVDLNDCTRDFPSEIISSGKNGYPGNDDPPIPPDDPPSVVVESTVDNLRIRNTPNVYGAVIGSIDSGDPVAVINDLGGGSWIQIQTGSTVGFIARQYTTGANGSDIANDAHVVGQVTANRVNLRNLPSTNSEVLTVMNDGDLFDVADDRSGDAWIYVRFEGINGYVARQYTNGANGNNVQ